MNKTVIALDGPSGSGKSTIAKIVSFCSWIEKNVILRPQTAMLM